MIAASDGLTLIEEGYPDTGEKIYLRVLAKTVFMSTNAVITLISDVLKRIALKLEYNLSFFQIRHGNI